MWRGVLCCDVSCQPKQRPAHTDSPVGDHAATLALLVTAVAQVGCPITIEHIVLLLVTTPQCMWDNVASTCAGVRACVRACMCTRARMCACDMT